MWKLDDERIKFGVRVKKDMKEGETVFLSYGPKSNGCLLLYFGFAILDNKYDYVRVKLEDKRLLEIGMKETIFVELKESELNYDLE